MSEAVINRAGAPGAAPAPPWPRAKRVKALSGPARLVTQAQVGHGRGDGAQARTRTTVTSAVGGHVITAHPRHSSSNPGLPRLES